jgi:hypothetical protein
MNFANLKGTGPRGHQLDIGICFGALGLILFWTLVGFIIWTIVH